mmetsp:Transcript_16734/g.22186  ORF Transcript_16734/g.22186 Transcript_16734/m.22186 type:complete len:81 (+) Transcript_16734:1328-1570(+)
MGLLMQKMLKDRNIRCVHGGGEFSGIDKNLQVIDTSSQGRDPPDSYMVTNSTSYCCCVFDSEMILCSSLRWDTVTLDGGD